MKWFLGGTLGLVALYVSVQQASAGYIGDASNVLNTFLRRLSDPNTPAVPVLSANYQVSLTTNQQKGVNGPNLGPSNTKTNVNPTLSGLNGRNLAPGGTQGMTP